MLMSKRTTSGNNNHAIRKMEVSKDYQNPLVFGCVASCANKRVVLHEEEVV